MARGQKKKKMKAGGEQRYGIVRQERERQWTGLEKNTTLFAVVWIVETRETREGWPLLTVEIEVNGDSKSTHAKGPSMMGSSGLLCGYKRFLSCLTCSSRTSSKKIFSPYTISNHLFPLPSKLGRQSCWVTCLLVCFSGNTFL